MWYDDAAFSDNISNIPNQSTLNNPVIFYLYFLSKFEIFSVTLFQGKFTVTAIIIPLLSSPEGTVPLLFSLVRYSAWANAEGNIPQQTTL